MNIIKLISDFKKNNSQLWVESDNIKLFVADDFDEINQFIDTVKKYKPEIVDFLASNKIFSKEDFKQKTIFKSPGNTALLSFAQSRLWFIEQYEQGSNAYHIPLVMELEAGTDPEGIKYAFQKIVSRHEVLRSTIEHGDDGEQGIQRVHEEPLSIEEITVAASGDFKSLIEEEINRPFDLSTEYPIRVKLYTIQPAEPSIDSSQNRTVLFINFHHIASDGWSIDIFEKEWAAYYEAYIFNDPDFNLPGLEIQYKDYAVWQRTHFTGEILETQINYWKNKLSGYQRLELPTDHKRPAEIDYRGANLVFTLGKETSLTLRALAQKFGVTMYSMLLSSINILLGKYTGQEDIITGSVSANRHHRQTQGLIGFFVNTQVNRSILNRFQSFQDLVQQVYQEQVQAQLYQDLPFEKLVVELGVERDPSQHPVFQVMFGLEAFGDQQETTEEQHPHYRPLQAEYAYDIEKFDLSIHIDDTRQELMGRISYATALFNTDTVERFIRHYIYLLKQLTEAPAQPYSRHSLLSAEEFEEVVYTWNTTGEDYPKEKTVCRLFEEQAGKIPDNTALVYEGQRLTYKELNEKSNQLARHIREKYLQITRRPLSPGTLVALYLGKSLEMVIGVLAVLKAGGAYVPLDINHPQERINYLLDDTGAALILGQRQQGEGNQLQLPPEKFIYIDLAEDLYTEEDTSNLQQYSEAEDFAYVIYTSGTTGKPKGVKITHQNLSNLIFAQKHILEINSESRVLQYASLVFDASVWEIFSALLHGAQLSVIPARLRQDASLLCDYLVNAKITIALLPPVLLGMMPYIVLDDLKTLLVGGDLSSLETMNRWSQGRRLINAYGPTEITVIATMHKYEAGDSHTNIGKPINNTSVYVLDNNSVPVPVGITGELYIGGAGVAGGYLNQPGLTQERFIPNPFATQSDKKKGHTRMYKTGDLVRWLPGGNLEFIHRNDDQVKIRGFRIEPGEIEHALSKIPGISQSCILVKERKTESGITKYLVGYYVLENKGEIPTQNIIHEKLAHALPEYMVPGVLVSLESFPLTISGKLDKRALPDPGLTSSAQGGYAAPANEIETMLCYIWQEVLGLERVGVTDDFFRIGGDSILSIQVSGRIAAGGF